MTNLTALEIADNLETANNLSELPWPALFEAALMLRTQHAEIERLQRIIDSRPAMNSGIVEAYAAWSSGIYESDIARAVGLDS